MSTFRPARVRIEKNPQCTRMMETRALRKKKSGASELTSNLPSVFTNRNQSLCASGDSRQRILRETFKHKQARYLSIIQTLSKKVDEQKQYLDKAEVMLLVIDTKGKISHINAKGCQILGYKQKEIIGRNWFDDFIPPRLKDEVFCLSQKLMSRDISAVAYHENPVLTRRGEERLISWYNTVIRDGGGNAISYYSAGVDITGRVREEKNRRILVQPGPEIPLTPLQEKYISTGVNDFNDREIIELFLSLTLPADTAGKLAQTCVERYHNLREFLAVPALQLQSLGIPRSCVLAIKLLHDLPVQILKEEIMNQPTYSSPHDFFNYLYYSMRDLDREVFKVVYLNARNQIIEITDLFKGTKDRIDLNAREVVESAWGHGTKSLIFVHNHPSGDPTPSSSDKGLTREMVFVGKIMGIKVLDHIVIGDNRYFSFASEGLIEEYEMDFLNLMLRGTAEARKKMDKSRQPNDKNNP